MAVKKFNMSDFKCIVYFYYVGIIAITAICLYNMSNYRHEKNPRELLFGSNCILPTEPIFGSWSLLYKLTKLSSKTVIPTGTILHIQCERKYKLDGANTSICINGRWIPETGNCLKTCPSMFGTSVMKVKCSYEKKTMKNCEEAIENTHVSFICAPFYKDNRRLKFNAICINGKWSEEPPQCVPVCGRKSSRAIALIINGTTTEEEEFPWQVAIYKNKELICGGTLLHERLILTAAHCISDNKGKLEPLENYTVVAGKYYRNYNHVSEEKKQCSSVVNAVYIPEDYEGYFRMYYGDIALIVPNRTFELSSRVQPICIDWNGKYEHSFWKRDEPVGHVCGWGNTIEYGNASEVLKSLQVPVIARKKCKEVLSDYREYITEDKFCAGYLNKSKSVCAGDSGSGLIFNHEGRYYIIGIVSNAPLGSSEHGGCNSQKLAVYTHVSQYIDDFIWEYYARFKPDRYPLVNYEDSEEKDPEVPTSTVTVPVQIQKLKTTDCLLPRHPDLGQWIIYGENFFEDGIFAKTGTMLKIICQEYYKLDGDKMIVCENGIWSSPMGKCLKTCPSIYNAKSMNITCFYKMGKLENCVDPVDGTTAKYQCAPFYEDMKIMEHQLFCSNGTWSPNIPQCSPKCGQKSVQDSIFMENNVPKGDYPWMTGIYRRSDHSFICSASLLNDNTLLTSAGCLKDSSNKTSKENFIIAVGKYFQEFNSTYDLQNAQFSDISQMHQFKSTVLIVVKKPFRFTFMVQPVCLDWENLINFENLEGYISVWSSPSEKSQPHELTVKVEVVSMDECRMSLNGDIVNMTDEKLCVRYPVRDVSLCLDRGGGLFVEHEDRYYVVGVMTDVPNMNEECVYSEYNLYTKIFYYNDIVVFRDLLYLNSEKK